MAFQSNSARAIYVACVTTFLTSLGFWVSLAHQDTVLAMRPQAGMVTDQQFAQEAAQGGMAEIKLGQLAQDKGSSEVVKSFGQRMVVEHTTAADRLKEAAAKENISLPDKLSSKDQSTCDTLSKLSVAEFDRAYARYMVKDHQDDLQAFQKEASSGKSEAIRSFASQTVSMIQQHLNQAKEMLKTVSPTAANRHKGSARQGRR